MKREIKFRAWDTEYKEWVTDTLLFYPLSGNVFNTKRRNLGEKSDKNVILMQFTGLKDKTGKEIYEGDIVIGDEPETETTTGELYMIVYDAFSCYATLRDAILDGKNVEVVGNVYQNPELLK